MRVELLRILRYSKALRGFPGKTQYERLTPAQLPQRQLDTGVAELAHGQSITAVRVITKLLQFHQHWQRVGCAVAGVVLVSEGSRSICLATMTVLMLSAAVTRIGSRGGDGHA